VEIMEAMGNFTVKPDATATKTYVFVGAGSGITPLFSMIKTLLHSEPQSRMYLIYGSRNEQQIIFKKPWTNSSIRFQIALKWSM